MMQKKRIVRLEKFLRRSRTLIIQRSFQECKTFRKTRGVELAYEVASIEKTMEMDSCFLVMQQVL